MRVAVCGAGVFGLTGALELARRGHEVVLIDPGPLPRPEAASTDLSKAVRLDYGDDAFHTELAMEARTGWLAWNEQFPEPLYHETGLLLLASSLEPGGFEAASRATVEALGIETTPVVRELLAERFPALAGTSYATGYHNPLGGWVESGRVMEHLLARARRTGVEVRGGEAPEGLLEERGVVAGVRTTSGAVEADRVLLAAGAWTPGLAERLGVDLEGRLRPTGQPLFFLRPERPELFRPPRMAVWTADVARTGWYGFPLLRDGTVKVGNHGVGRPLGPDETREVTEEERTRLESFLVDAFPVLAELPLVGTRLCLYCDTEDGDFLLDAHPDRPGLVLATGGSGHAFKFAPVLGPLVADAVEGRDHPRLRRYRWRRPPAGPGEAARRKEKP